MKCIDCRIDEATEFTGLTGEPIKQGRCKFCYERMIIRGGKSFHKTGAAPPEAKDRTLSRQGTEEIGRPGRSWQVAAEQT